MEIRSQLPVSYNAVYVFLDEKLASNNHTYTRPCCYRVGESVHTRSISENDPEIRKSFKLDSAKKFLSERKFLFYRSSRGKISIQRVPSKRQPVRKVGKEVRQP